MVQSQQRAEHVARSENDAVEPELRPDHGGREVPLCRQRQQQRAEGEHSMQEDACAGQPKRLAGSEGAASPEEARDAEEEMEQRRESERFVHMVRIVVGDKPRHLS
eukprot:CAMPEP_0184381326 /NCGR_PEP_ID=MMETSP0007-20130409/5421_1 /TAXON_ID=97485 /ORGANISM="Prymnesium parvum, Strain Texoma1" /LENGTH=105 /DNA_ID=CAMNT_0026726887 /DNA_START=1361 /DNA_END=1675 /DNA_ORIENTATION=-